ncbi:MAG TPA: SRPBCC family protein [Acidimicrobiales bacterium]|nr:SRPBCC family protein [Acidimicrobiales bacterium]
MARGSPHVISFQETWRLAAPPEVVWEEVEHLERFPWWFDWLGRYQVEGEGLVEGTVLRGVVRPPLPYRMVLAVHLDHCARPHRIEATVSGDLEGTGAVALRPEGPGASRATASWRLEMRQPAMRAAARVAAPLLRWGHDRVIDATVGGFRRHIEPAARR